MARLPAAGRTLAILLAIVLAAVATFAIYVYVDQADERAREEVELVEVFRATGIIRAGTPIETAQANGLIERSEELAAQVPSDAVGQLGDLAGLVARTDILPQDVIRAGRFATAADAAKSFEVPEDQNAISVLVGTVEGVAGFVNVEDRVSIIVHFDDFPDIPGVDLPQNPAVGEAAEAGGALTKFVLQDMQVLALGQRVKVQTEAGTADAIQQAADGTLFTLAVSEQQAEILVFAQKTGTLHFTLLPEDFEPLPTDGVRFVNLFA